MAEHAGRFFIQQERACNQGFGTLEEATEYGKQAVKENGGRWVVYEVKKKLSHLVDVVDVEE